MSRYFQLIGKTNSNGRDAIREMLVSHVRPYRAKTICCFFFCSLFFVLFAVVLLRVVHAGSKVINVMFQSSICAAGGIFLISRTPRCEFKGASLELCS